LERIDDGTVIIGDKEIMDENNLKDYNFVNVPFTKIAKEIGGQIYFNIIATGMLVGILDIEKDFVIENIKNQFKKKSDEIIKNNIDAINRGYEIGKELEKNETIVVEIDPEVDLTNNVILNGSESIGIGAIAGGCNFIASYPMSPSTGVLTYLSKMSKEFEIVVDQAEDEISAINMALGASYAGARAMVTTSGGGFALMNEALSLSGMTETPVVIHIAQRPGPATGLPTRTEQGDLQHVLYSGHGDFPRIILAPGTIEEGIELTHHAFNLADKYQVPVFILTDQYFVDSFYDLNKYNLSELKNEYHFIETGENYRRYEITENGISPRGVPGYGKGLVTADSDEHDENGRITEDHDMRIKMVRKRLNKLDTIQKDIISPEFYGEKDYKGLIIGWGSTCNIISEALEYLKGEQLAFLHFKQIYPLNPIIKKYLAAAEFSIVVENNVTGQFSNLIQQETCTKIDYRVLKYNGLPFAVEEVVTEIKEILGRRKENE
jgi:2-oxoglutarate ferredoxin oxidoreductase subunit alpha